MSVQTMEQKTAKPDSWASWLPDRDLQPKRSPRRYHRAGRQQGCRLWRESGEFVDRRGRGRVRSEGDWDHRQASGFK